MQPPWFISCVMNHSSQQPGAQVPRTGTTVIPPKIGVFIGIFRENLLLQLILDWWGIDRYSMEIDGFQGNGVINLPCLEPLLTELE